MFKRLVDWLRHEDRQQQHLAAFVLLMGSGIGLLASLVISVEALMLAKNTQTVLNCDLNSAISCSVVANHWSAELLGFPNSFIGLATLPVMVTIAVALLAGVRFPRWFMQAAQMGTVVGFFFALWMFYMSYVEIGVLCPWCLTTDVGMLMIFYGLTRYNVLTGNIKYGTLRRWVEENYDLVVLLSIIAVAVAMIIGKFGEQLF